MSKNPPPHPHLLKSPQPVDVKEITIPGNSALVDLANRLNSAINSRSTNFTMSVAEAGAVFAAISQIINQNSELNTKIFEMQNDLLKEKSTVTHVVMDAGRF